MITNEALFVLRNNLTGAKRINRQYDGHYGVEGAKIGTVLNIRKPAKFLAIDGPGLVIQDITETSVPLTLTSQKHVGFTFTTADLKLSIDDFSERILEPAITPLANVIDYDVLQNYNNIANTVGTLGTVPNTFLTYATAGAVLSNNATPMDGRRSILINPIFEATIVDALKSLFQSATQIKDQYEKGQMATASGFDWFMDQNCPTHTIGPLGGTPLVSGAGQTGSSLVTKGWTAAAAKRLSYGDVIQLDLGLSTQINNVNPVNQQNTGRFQDFTVMADVYSDGAGNATIPIFPAITTSGAFQTVTANPGNNATISVFGVGAAGQAAIANTASATGLAIHRDCITLATADLPLPGAGVVAAYRVADPDLGISLRIVQAYDINTDKMPVRCDVLYGTQTLRGELGCRIIS